jgi:RimJ/RimL family protein N-acetyltransferase
MVVSFLWQPDYASPRPLQGGNPPAATTPACIRARGTHILSRMSPRLATPADIPMLARLHAAAWRETYTGLLPDAEIDRACNPTARQVQWARITANPKIRSFVLDDLGFACIGPQRFADMQAKGFPEELLSIYLLRIGQHRGHGKALLRAALGPTPQPLTARALVINTRACAFYAHLGGQPQGMVDDHIGDALVTEQVYAWDQPRMLMDPVLR